jgi:hypothetical protein
MNAEFVDSNILIYAHEDLAPLPPTVETPRWGVSGRARRFLIAGSPAGVEHLREGVAALEKRPSGASLHWGQR